jgi:hypothetical protein
MDMTVDHVREASNRNEREPMTDHRLTIRLADAADSSALARLAALDSAAPPTGDVMLAEVGDELWAAIELESGAAIADPFRPSGELVDMLRLRTKRAKRSERGALARLLPRAA